MARGELQRGEPDPGRDTPSAQTRFRLENKIQPSSTVEERLVSIYSMPGTLLRTVHRSGGWEE